MTYSETFDCERWPRCGCPDGAVDSDCPALKRLLERDTGLRPGDMAEVTDQDGKMLDE